MFNLLSYVVGVVALLSEHCDFFRLKWENLGCPPGWNLEQVWKTTLPKIFQPKEMGDVSRVQNLGYRTDPKFETSRLCKESTPSYHPNSRAPETPQYDALLAPFNEVTMDLHRLLNGPKGSLTSLMLAHYDLVAFQVALEFGFFEAVPIGNRESIALKNLSKIVKVDEDRVRRIMKFLATHCVFVETETDIFQHTSASALFSMDVELTAAGLMQSVVLKIVFQFLLPGELSNGRIFLEWTRCLGPHPRLLRASPRRHIILIVLIHHFAPGLACLYLNTINRTHIKRPDLHALWWGLLRVRKRLSLTGLFLK